MGTIETERLSLRMFRPGDLDAYAQMCAKPEVMRYINDGRTLTREDAWRNMALVLGHWELRGYGLWAVEERATQQLIGRIGHWNPEGWPGFEVGWMLDSNYWGRGFATEGALAALKCAFTVLSVPHVISLIHPDNKLSIRVAENIGEKLEGETEVSHVRLLIYGIYR